MQGSRELFWLWASRASCSPRLLQPPAGSPAAGTWEVTHSISKGITVGRNMKLSLQMVSECPGDYSGQTDSPSTVSQTVWPSI